MKKNVGTLDALLRISIGFIGLAWSIARLSQKNRRANRFVPWMVTVFSALKIAEGINRYCPLLGLFNLSTMKTDKEIKAPHSIAHFPRRKAIL